MTGIKLDLDETTLQEAFNRALVAQIDDAARERIIGQAVAWLTKPENRGGYGYDNRSPIQRAFDEAARNAVQQMADRYVTANPEFAEAVRKLMTEATAKALADDSELRRIAAEAIARAVTSALHAND